MLASLRFRISGLQNTQVASLMHPYWRLRYEYVGVDEGLRTWSTKEVKPLLYIHTAKRQHLSSTRFRNYCKGEYSVRLCRIVYQRHFTILIIIIIIIIKDQVKPGSLLLTKLLKSLVQSSFFSPPAAFHPPSSLTFRPAASTVNGPFLTIRLITS